MAVVEKVAKEFHMRPEELMKESLKVYLNRKINTIDSELFILARRYGVKNVFELDEAIKEGRFHEEDSLEDYFKFDNLEAERDRIKEYLEQI
ncbi:hypothetical protein KKH56_08380 [bacterium]|nr:hypothetical protein [bacterium]